MNVMTVIATPAIPKGRPRAPARHPDTSPAREKTAPIIWAACVAARMRSLVPSCGRPPGRRIDECRPGPESLETQLGLPLGAEVRVQVGGVPLHLGDVGEQSLVAHPQTGIRRHLVAEGAQGDMPFGLVEVAVRA